MNDAAPVVAVWSPRDSPRLRYMLDWLFGERLGLEYRLTHDRSEVLAAQHGIAYGWMEDVASIHATSLLWEADVKRHDIRCEEWQGLHTLYFDENSPCDIQFDMLAGIFYLLTRYEEYLPFTPDRHGRFPAQQSILFSVLERPVVDEWVEALRRFLEQVWAIVIPGKPFAFQPTYDIDIAWSYRFKGLKRSLGAAFKEIAQMNGHRLRRRFRVWRRAEADPYDSFVFLLAQHMMDKVRPVYFMLVALQPSRFDKNISPRHPRMMSLIRALSESSTPGLHPSYYSDEKPERLMQEKAVLDSITQNQVVHSRQHFIRLRFPQTYRSLIATGIEQDWSMGYSTHFGFRAGASQSFLWYDLKEEYCTSLRVHPFAFMDSTAHYDLGLSAEDAFVRLRQMAGKLQPCGGRLVTIMHNYSLGTDEEWKGWRREYERFLQEMSSAMKGTS